MTETTRNLDQEDILRTKQDLADILVLNNMAIPQRGSNLIERLLDNGTIVLSETFSAPAPEVIDQEDIQNAINRLIDKGWITQDARFNLIPNTDPITGEQIIPIAQQSTLPIQA